MSGGSRSRRQQRLQCNPDVYCDCDSDSNSDDNNINATSICTIYFRLTDNRYTTFSSFSRLHQHFVRTVYSTIRRFQMQFHCVRHVHVCNVYVCYPYLLSHSISLSSFQLLLLSNLHTIFHRLLTALTSTDFFFVCHTKERKEKKRKKTLWMRPIHFVTHAVHAMLIQNRSL